MLREEDRDMDALPPEFWRVGDDPGWAFGFRYKEAKRASVCNGRRACIVYQSTLPMGP